MNPLIETQRLKNFYIYLYGSPVQRTLLLKEAAEHGDCSAQVCFAHRHTVDDTDDLFSIEKDPKRAILLYKKYAKQNNFEAQCALVNFYDNGVFLLGYDKGKAKKLLKQYADQGNPKAQLELALSYRNKRFSDKQKIEKSQKLLKHYADQKNEQAQIKICGDLCWEEKFDDAYQLTETYAQQGNHCAQNLLAQFYLQGLCGVQKDVQKALSIYKTYAEKGNVDASFELFQIYRPGSLDGRIYNISEDFEQSLYYANQIMMNEKVEFTHHLVHSLHRAVLNVVKRLLFKGEVDKFEKLAGSPLRPLLNLNYPSLFVRQPILEWMCWHGVENAPLILLNAHMAYGLEQIDFLDCQPLKKLMVNSAKTIDTGHKQVAEMFLVAGAPEFRVDPSEIDDNDEARQIYNVFGNWFDNMKVVSLKLMILRKYVYCTTGDKCKCVQIPSYYPKPLYFWPTYDHEMMKNDAFNNRIWSAESRAKN